MPERLDDVANVLNNFVVTVRKVRKHLVTRILLQTEGFVHLDLLVNLLLTVLVLDAGVGRVAAVVVVVFVLLVKAVHHCQMDTVG
jgi:hypothetical protein